MHKFIILQKIILHVGGKCFVCAFCIWMYCVQSWFLFLCSIHCETRKHNFKQIVCNHMSENKCKVLFLLFFFALKCDVWLQFIVAIFEIWRFCLDFNIFGDFFEINHGAWIQKFQRILNILHVCECSNTSVFQCSLSDKVLFYFCPVLGLLLLK